MPTEVILPKVDMDMTHGTLAVWHVAPGDMVAKGAALFDIETDKAAMEVESPATGRLHSVTAQPGDRVPVGTVVALIYAEGEVIATAPEKPTLEKPAPEKPAPAQPTTAPIAAQPARTPVSAATPTPPLEGGSTRATPAARAAARAAGLNIADIPGTGPLGRVQQGDVPQPSTVTPHTSPALWLPQPGPLHISHRKGTGLPLVLIHGFTADSQSWAPLEKCLPPDRPLIRIDLPGHGKSPHRHVASFADLARMMVDAFDDATRAHDSVHLLGHSLGAALAVAIADIRTRRVASLSLIAPAGLGPEIDAATLMGIVRASRAESLAPWLRRLTATPDAITDGYAAAAMRARQNPALRAVQADMADSLFPDGVQPFDLRAALARAAMPTAIIWGRQDRIIPWQQALAPNGDFAIHLMQGAGHIPHIECPDRVAAIIAR